MTSRRLPSSSERFARACREAAERYRNSRPAGARIVRQALRPVGQYRPFAGLGRPAVVGGGARGGPDREEAVY